MRRLYGDCLLSMRMMQAKPVRSFLSMLGIYIGMLALIVILSLHEAMKRKLAEMYHTEGARIEYVQPGFDPASQKFGMLDFSDAAAMSAVPGVLSVLPRLNSEMDATSADRHAKVQFIGTDLDFLKIYGVPIVEGRSFLPDEIARRKSVCLLSRAAAMALFPHGRAIGSTVRTQGGALLVLGLFDWDERLAQRSNIPDPTAPALVPVSWLERSSGLVVTALELRVDPSLPFDEVAARAKLVMSHGDAQRGLLYSYMTMEDTLKLSQESNRQLLNSLMGIAAISLLVGGIGVANVMLISVAERTREIGIRKALGARRKDILAQFLVESTMMTVTSGLSAVFTGWAATQALSTLISTDTVGLAFPPLPAASCLLITCAIGLVAGLYPASRACLQAPAAALRYE